MLYGIYNHHDTYSYGEWVAAQPSGLLYPPSGTILEIFTTSHLGHALAQLSVWRRNHFFEKDGGTLRVAVIGKDGEPSRFVGEEEV